MSELRELMIMQTRTVSEVARAAMEAAREAAKAVAAVGYIAERSGQQQQNVQLQINEQQNVAQTAALAKLEQPLMVMAEAVAHVAQKPVLGQDNENSAPRRSS